MNKDIIKSVSIEYVIIKNDNEADNLHIENINIFNKMRINMLSIGKYLIEEFKKEKYYKTYKAFIKERFNFSIETAYNYIKSYKLVNKLLIDCQQNPESINNLLTSTSKSVKQFVKDLKREAVICFEDSNLKTVAKQIIDQNMNHIVITDRENNLKGIVTSFDVTKAIAQDKTELNKIITKKVIITTDNEPIDVAARKMKLNEISALPVVDENNKVVGIITSEELM